MIYDAYLYEICQDLTFIDGRITCRKKNGPMNNRLIKLHKGVDNRVNFRIRDTDLKKVDISSMNLKIKMVNVENQEKVLEKYMTHDSCKGWALLDVFEGDLVDIAPGFYELVILAEDQTEYGRPDYYSQKPFYTNETGDVVFDVEVTEQAQANTQPSIEIKFEDFTPNYFATQPKAYVTSAIPCNALRNHKNATHTFAVYSDNFSGDVEVYGSLDVNPPSSLSEYFPVQVISNSNKISYENFSGIDPFTFTANLVWVKFKIIESGSVIPEDQGKITKIVWRS